MKLAISHVGQGNEFFHDLGVNPPRGGTTLYNQLHHIADAFAHPGAQQAQPKTSLPGKGRGKPKIMSKTLNISPTKKAPKQ